MSNDKMPETLAAAMAAYQAELPKITKGETANTGTYSYKYADLAYVSDIVLKKLGALGVSFTSKPTLVDGEFALAYSLRHASGDKDEGVFPLPKAGTMQQIGSAITYARRYCLLAITGTAPGDEDDDGASASQQHMETSRPRRSAPPPDRAQRNGQRSQDRPPPPDGTLPDTDDFAVWRGIVNEITSGEDAERADADLKEVFRAGDIDATKANQVRMAIKVKAAKVREAAGAPA